MTAVPRLIITLIVSLAAAGSCAAGPLETVFARLDRTAVGLTDLSANVRRVVHTAVLNEDDVETGTFLFKRNKAHDVHVLLDIKEPEPRLYAIDLRKVEVYLPRIQTVQEYDISRYKSLAEEFLLLGFGATSTELEALYTISFGGPEDVGKEKTARLELVPKSKEMLEHVTKVELWISDTLGVPVQQKFYTPGENYNLVTYSNIMINPHLADSAVRLNLPKGVKREHPLK